MESCQTSVVEWSGEIKALMVKFFWRVTVKEMLLFQARQRPPAKPIGGTDTKLVREKTDRALEMEVKEGVLISHRNRISGLEEERRSLRARIALGLASPWQFEEIIFIDYSFDLSGPLEPGRLE